MGWLSRWLFGDDAAPAVDESPVEDEILLLPEGATDQLRTLIEATFSGCEDYEPSCAGCRAMKMLGFLLNEEPVDGDGYYFVLDGDGNTEVGFVRGREVFIVGVAGAVDGYSIGPKLAMDVRPERLFACT